MEGNRGMGATAEIRRRLGHSRFLPRAIRTSAFRYTLAYFIVFIVSFAGIGLIVFASTLNATMKRLDLELEADLAYFAQVNISQGPDGWAGLTAVASEVARLKVIERDSLYAVYVGPKLRQLTSDIGILPPKAINNPNMFRFEYPARVLNYETGQIETETRPAVGRVATFLYAGAEGEEKVPAIILTARDTSEISRVTDAASAIAIRVMIFAPFLALILGLLFSSTFLRRVDRIGQTVKAIRDGDLTKRIALTGTRDEFDTLSDNINAMLDQIERLMTGMRQVSDNIAHDLRSPLTRIKARLDSALNDPEANLEDILDRTNLDVERLLATFNALLSITRIESGEGGGSRVSVDIAEVAEEMLELYEPAADDAGFTLISNIVPAPEVLGSRELISQAIANLLDNAFKYARHPDDVDIEPTIELTVAPRPGGGALLSVMDNGPGVSEEDQERILQRFVRLERSRSTMGNGLGLSLVSAIARRHSAQLSIGRGLPQHPGGRALTTNSDYGLGVRIAFPPPPRETKTPLAAAAEKNAATISQNAG
ncbi:sensor histidine kinase [Parvularcula marina]|uniref:histidine kinase n=2 Tax=Parvularcula marina TaxID=2292771 RepID=A0A371RKE8_9PROT|nr:sensor histidine kinase [Parvularcula marina]